MRHPDSIMTIAASALSQCVMRTHTGCITPLEGAAGGALSRTT